MSLVWMQEALKSGDSAQEVLAKRSTWVWSEWDKDRILKSQQDMSVHTKEIVFSDDKMSDLWHTRGNETRTGALSCPLDEDSLECNI